MILIMRNHKFYRFYKQYDGFKEMSLDSKHNKMKEFNRLLLKLWPEKTGNTIQKGASYKKY